MSHHPPHILLDDTWYIVTSSTLYGRRYFAAPALKQLLLDELDELVKTYGIRLVAWVVLDNHYHILFKSRVGKDLPRFFGRLHGATSREVNRRHGILGRQVWHNYWDTCILDKAGFWTRFNYIHHNPVKHRYVKRMEDWPYSSYQHYLASKGQEWLDECWRRYPVIDHLEGDDFDVDT